MNREAASAGDERAKKTISRLSTQQKVFDAVSRFADGIEGEDRFEAYVQAMDNLLSQWSTDSMDGKSKPTVWLRDLNIEDVMEAAGEVERKLFDERERAKHQKENPSASTASTEPGQNEKAEIDERLEEERAKFGTVVQMVKANLQDGNLGTYFEAFIKSSPNIEQYVAATKELMSINKDFLMDENHHQRVQEYVTRVKEVAERLASK
jgi:hypothetical protein